MRRTMRYTALTAAFVLAGTWTVTHGQTGDCYTQAPGCLDLTFGTNGLVATPSSGGIVKDVAIQNVAGEQRIVVVGGSPWGMARYRSNGALDTTFGVGGVVTKTFAVARARTRG